MGWQETDTINRWLKRWNRWGVLFRVNVGRYWAGRVVEQWTKDGVRYVTLSSAQPVHMGVTGQSDYNGWHSMTITPDMVGRTVAVYVAVEGKAGEAGRVSAEQERHLEIVMAAGGIGLVVRSPDTAPPDTPWS
jgi:hypothetical protein